MLSLPLPRQLKSHHPVPFFSGTLALFQNPGVPLCLKAFSRDLSVGSLWHLACLLSGTHARVLPLAELVSDGDSERHPQTWDPPSPELDSGGIFSDVSVCIGITDHNRLPASHKMGMPKSVNSNPWPCYLILDGDKVGRPMTDQSAFVISENVLMRVRPKLHGWWAVVLLGLTHGHRMGLEQSYTNINVGQGRCP